MKSPDVTKEQLANFRSSLGDVVDLVTILGPLCSSVGELVEMCELAQSNDGQAQFIMKLLVGDKKK